MKGIKFLLVLAVMFSAVSFSAQAQNKKKKNLEEVTYNVYLHCDDCVKKAQAVVPAAVKGIKDFKVSLEDQTFWIQFDPAKNTKANIVAVLAKKGYDVKEVKPGEKGDAHKHDHNHEHGHDHNHDHGHNHSH